MMDLTMRAKLLPAPYIIKNFVGGEDNCNYEIYLLELLNSSAWFSAHYLGGFTTPSPPVLSPSSPAPIETITAPRRTPVPVRLLVTLARSLLAWQP